MGTASDLTGGKENEVGNKSNNSRKRLEKEIAILKKAKREHLRQKSGFPFENIHAV